MTLKMKWAGGLAVAVVVTVLLGWVFSEVKLGRLERIIQKAELRARVSEERAVAAEAAAGEYRKKIEYLEAEVAGIGEIARRQDEELEKIGGDVGAGRRDVERARSVRAIDATTDELCAKLAELGHGC